MGISHRRQYNGVALPGADDTPMVTCWVGVTEATPENGCLRVVPGNHREGMTLHCTTKDRVAIPDALTEQEHAVPIPLNPGGMLVFHPLCKHASLENNSDAFRWSFDLRYNPIGQPSGTPHFPGSVAQSRVEPETELHDAQRWAQFWYDVRARLSQSDAVDVHRRDSSDPRCA